MLPSHVAELGGLNRIGGFLVSDDDIIILGDHDPRWPPIHIDDLMIGLRSGYEVSASYHEAPGCSIDPRIGAADPWLIQDVRVLGIETSDCRMAARHVALDYELKYAGAGLREIPGVHDTFSARRGRDLCAGAHTSEAVTTGFWFCAAYPEERPRFEVDGPAVLIRHPVGVRVLSERSFLGATNNGSGAEPDPVAAAFAADVTHVLASETRREYQALVNDFRVIELGRVLNFRTVPASRFEYLLYEHRLSPIAVPRLVRGIRRAEQVQMSCDEAPNGGGLIRSVKRSSEYRGGVEAHIDIPAGQFVEKAGGMRDQWLDRVIRSRPAADSLIWAVNSGVG
jgi:hypothetical protein